ncbi:hypothetical protein HORIV_60640 [Vreelandella olivaria]|uniref:Uncharacterized protein n=1 Tax=Vreelandella olivaria TaxID=390919 RepID=A0ABM7GSE6_9GAMM|nr:hypothetical protein HORIV_60640 [Halomonas olivaria]
MSKHDSTPHLPRRKRSGRLSLAMMGASAFGLTACGQPPQEEQITDIEFDQPRSFQSVEDCVAENVYTRSACEDAYEASLKRCRAIARLKSAKLKMVKGRVLPQPTNSPRPQPEAPGAVGLCPP